MFVGPDAGSWYVNFPREQMFHMISILGAWYPIIKVYPRITYSEWPNNPNMHSLGIAKSKNVI